MIVDKVVTGYLEENCYLIEKDNKVIVIDPGDEAPKIIKKINDRNVCSVIITHHHFDHVGALNEILKKYNLKETILEEGKHNLEGFNIEVINTPGHTKDSKCYYFYDENIMFTGDFVFKNSIGRCDLEGGNIKEMNKSIERIKKYNDKIKIFPGHGDSTTLGYEKKYNMFF